MIQTFKLPVPGGFIASAYYRQAGIPRFVNKFTSNEIRAENLIKQMKKDVLREKVSKFINHRQNIMDYHGGIRTMERYNAIEKMKNNFAFMRDKSLESNCKLVLDYEELFKTIMPGEKSAFHQSAKETLWELLEFCKLEIKITI